MLLDRLVTIPGNVTVRRFDAVGVEHRFSWALRPRSAVRTREPEYVAYLSPLPSPDSRTHRHESRQRLFNRSCAGCVLSSKCCALQIENIGSM